MLNCLSQIVAKTIKIVMCDFKIKLDNIKVK